MKIYEFLYNSDCCESAAHTMSLHKTRSGAERAMKKHQNKIRSEHNTLGLDDEFDWDFDQAWFIRETELLE